MDSSNEWQTVSTKKRPTSSNKEKAFVPKHKRENQRRPQRQRFEHFSQRKNVHKKAKPQPIITEETFPTLGGNVVVKETAISFSGLNLEKNQKIQSKKVIIEESNKKSREESLIFLPQLPECIPFHERPVYNYDPATDEYTLRPPSPLSYHELEEVEERTAIRRETLKSMKEPEDREDREFLSSVNCYECCDVDGLDPEHMHQMCPTGYHGPDKQWHRWCYLCTRCLRKLYIEWQVNKEEVFRTSCGHLLDMKEFKWIMGQTDEDNNVWGQRGFDAKRAPRFA